MSGDKGRIDGRYPRREARILDIISEPASGIFRIDEDTTSPDVVATLRYLNPSEDDVTDVLCRLLQNVYATGWLGSQTVSLRGEQIANSGVYRNHQIRFAAGRPFADIIDELEMTFGPENSKYRLREIAEILIDRGLFSGLQVKVDARNEFANMINGNPDVNRLIADEIDSWG